MNNRTINKVRVILDFPGYKEGDVLELDSKAGLFHFTNVTNEDGTKGDAFDIFAARITGEMKNSITKKEVLSYMGTLFEDISTYKVRSAGELERRVHEISNQIDNLETGVNLMSGIDKEEALTVWQNMLWEYEWILGMRELYNVPDQPEQLTVTSGDVQRAKETELENFDPSDYIDGNAQEEATAPKHVKQTGRSKENWQLLKEFEDKQNESADTNEVREDS